jgi:hypothetical protein
MKVLKRERRKNHTYTQPEVFKNINTLWQFAKYSKLKKWFLVEIIHNTMINEKETKWIDYKENIQIKFVFDNDVPEKIISGRPYIPC